MFSCLGSSNDERDSEVWSALWVAWFSEPLESGTHGILSVYFWKHFSWRWKLHLKCDKHCIIFWTTWELNAWYSFALFLEACFLTMKAVSKCDKHCELHDSVNHLKVARVIFHSSSCSCSCCVSLQSPPLYVSRLFVCFCFLSWFALVIFIFVICGFPHFSVICSSCVFFHVCLFVFFAWCFVIFIYRQFHVSWFFMFFYVHIFSAIVLVPLYL